MSRINAVRILCRRLRTFKLWLFSSTQVLTKAMIGSTLSIEINIAPTNCTKISKRNGACAFLPSNYISKSFSKDG